jgi:hypothetical protein
MGLDMTLYTRKYVSTFGSEDDKVHTHHGRRTI